MKGSLLIFGLMTAVAAGLKCYFCKSDFDSQIEDEEEKVKDIPYCGGEPYKGRDDQVVVCDIYFDNFGMTNPTFKEALSSTTESSPDSTARMKRHHKNEAESTPGDDQTDQDIGNYDQKDRHKMKLPPKANAEGVDTVAKARLRKTVYPYNLSGAPWGTQRVHPRVNPYLCLTVQTSNSTFPSRVCGLKYFMDCQLLIELTSEPLEESSFVTRCNQCSTDYCNQGRQEDINFSHLVLISILVAINSVNF